MKTFIIYVLLNGLWTLPVKSTPTDLFLFAEKTGKATAYLRINKNCHKPIYTRMTGKVSRSKCGVMVNLKSKSLKVSKTCNATIMMKACGTLSGKKFNAIGAVVSTVMCGKKIKEIRIDSLKGTWKKSGAYGSAPISI